MAGSDALVPVADDGGAQRPALPPGVIASARRFVEASCAASTWAKYTAVWEMFSALAHGHAALPAVVAGYLAAEASRGGSPSWVQLQLAAIGWVHRRAGRQPPQRTELVALRREDLTRVPEGVRVIIRRSKGDQEGQGAEIAVPEGRRLHPVRHLEA